MIFCVHFLNYPGNSPDWAWLAKEQQSDVFNCSVVGFVWGFGLIKTKVIFPKRNPNFSRAKGMLVTYYVFEFDI